MPFDPMDLALAALPMAYEATIGRQKKKKAQKKTIRNEYQAEKFALEKETSDFLGDSQFRALASGGMEGSLAPSINNLLTTRLEDLRKKKQKELEAV